MTVLTSSGGELAMSLPTDARNEERGTRHKEEGRCARRAARAAAGRRVERPREAAPGRRDIPGLTAPAVQPRPARDAPGNTRAVSTRTLPPGSTRTLKLSISRGAGPATHTPAFVYVAPWHGQRNQPFEPSKSNSGRQGSVQPRCVQR